MSCPQRLISAEYVVTMRYHNIFAAGADRTLSMSPDSLPNWLTIFNGWGYRLRLTAAAGLRYLRGMRYPGDGGLDARGAEFRQVEVAVDAAELVIGFEHPGGAPAQRHRPVRQRTQC